VLGLSISCCLRVLQVLHDRDARMVGLKRKKAVSGGPNWMSIIEAD